MKIINTDTLKIGDIILTTSAKPISLGIRFATKSDISHAMICVSKNSVMDSTSEGVQARNVQKIFYEDSCPIYILRANFPLSDQQTEELIKYARAVTGMPYSKAEAISLINPQGDRNGSREEFCSRMVARAYAAAGIQLVENPDFCTPEDLKKSELLEFVENPSIQLSTEEYSSRKEIEDTTDGMRKVTNLLLKKVRALDSNVKSLNDIDDLLIKHPELDRAIAEAYKSSGYLDYWDVEVRRFPWRYDLQRMLDFYNSSPNKATILKFCRNTLDSENTNITAHWRVNFQIYSQKYLQFNFETFYLLLGLYKKILTDHGRKVESASGLLKFLEQNSDE